MNVKTYPHFGSRLCGTSLFRLC